MWVPLGSPEIPKGAWPPCPGASGLNGLSKELLGLGRVNMNRWLGYGFQSPVRGILGGQVVHSQGGRQGWGGGVSTRSLGGASPPPTCLLRLLEPSGSSG